MTSPTFGSLFAGIGGIDLGLERVGWECRWQVEIDPFCRQVLSKHWNQIPQYGDIRELDPDALEPVNLICGGFPCQPVSRTGRREAEADDRWLWGEMFRVISGLRPRYALVENTDGLPHRGLGTVLSDLASIGYDAEWESVSAAHFGAPHVRQRLFLVAYPHSDRREVPALPGGRPIPDSQRHHSIQEAGWEEFERRVGGPVPESPGSRPGGTHDGLPGRMDRCRALGNAVVPQVVSWIGEQILNHMQAHQ